MKSALLAVLSFSIAAVAGQPRLTNAKLETRALTGELDGAIRSVAGPAWVGYSVASIGGFHGDCPMRLEGENANLHGFEAESREIVVLIRVTAGVAGKIRIASVACDLDAGGLPFLWLTGVAPAESVRWLSALAGADDRHLSDAAVMAVAQHAGPESDSALEAFVAPSRSERLREKAAFWLGASRGERGVATLERMLHDDPSAHVREKVVFALSVNNAPKALDLLISTAHSDQDAHVRGQAIFWLGQKAANKAVKAIGAAVSDDPDTGVKRHAVFALSQIPHGEGVPTLIDLARTNRHPEVRKQAVFWLGQSKDPRALKFFEDVLQR